MRLIADMTGFKGRLLLSTALTAAVFIPVSATATQTVINGKETVSNSGVIQGEYRLDGGTWTGSGGEIKGIDRVEGIPDTGTFENGFYQESKGGLSIEGANTRIDFNGGVIWDSSAYIPSFSKDAYGTLYNGVRVYSDEISGNVLVNNGTFTGAVEIRKGYDRTALLGKDADGKTVEYPVRSKGDLIISSGSFFLSKNSNFKMYKTNVGTLYMRGGNWFVGYDIGADGTEVAVSTPVITTVDAANNALYLRGGKYKIAEKSVLKLTGLSGTMDADSASYEFSGKGTLSVGFGNGFTINSNIKWDDGQLKQSFGSLTIQKEVTVNSFTQELQDLKLVIDKGGVLSVSSDVSMNGNMSGKGTLKLTGKANGKIGDLTEFGTIIVGGGTLTFAHGNDTQKTALDYLVGATGDGKIGTIEVEGQTYAGTVTLNNSVMRLTAELITDALDMGQGDIVFIKGNNGVSNGRLTLKGETTIWNNSRIITEATTEYADATSGVMTAKDGTVLTFADADGTDENTHFESGALTVSVENGASVVSNARRVSFDVLKMTQGTATVESGILDVNNAVLGDGTANAGTLTVNAGGTANVKNTLTAGLGAKIEINGVLNVGTLETKGQKDGVSTITGSGTLNITKSADLKGLINGLAHLNVTGSAGATASATFGGEYSDVISEMKVTYGEVRLEKSGTLTIDSLLLDHGAILLENEKSVLALRRSPGEDGSFSGERNSISGKGTLELLGNTDIKFSGGTTGNIGYLGGLKIGQGTATITGDTMLGGVSFSDNGGGTLQIGKDATLTLSDEGGTCAREDKCRITINAGDTVKGEGTLRLVNGDGSKFSGTVDLGRLKLDSGVSRTITFNSATESKIGVLDTNADSNIVVDSGLTIGRIDGDATFSGNGTLTVNGQASGGFMTTTGTLANLKVGGDLVVKDAKIGNIVFTNGSGLTVQGTTTVSNITTGANNVVSGNTLTLSGTGTFAANSVQTKVLSVLSSAKAIFAGNNALKNLDLQGSAVINRGATLTLAQASVGEANSVIMGEGTLTLNQSGLTVNALLSKLGKLTVSQSATLKNTAQVDTITAADGATLTVNAAAQADTVSIASGAGLIQNADMTVGTLSFGANSGSTLTVNKTLTVIRNIAAASNTLNGTGTVNLSGRANGSFATGDSFKNGNLRIGSGTASFTGDTSMASVVFSGNNGTLSIDAEKTLTLASIKTKASNVLTGKGTLKLTGTGSTFDAPIASLGKLNIAAGGGANFSQSANIGTVAFDNGGSLTVGGGAVLTAANLMQSGTTFGRISGAGAFRIGAGTADFTTGGNSIGGLYIGSGKLNVKGDSKAGKVVFESADGKLNVDNSTLTVSDALTASGTVGGNGALVLENGGRFEKALTFGTITTGSGALTFYEDATLGAVDVGNGSAYFRKGAAVSNLKLTAGEAFFNGENTQIGNLSMSGAGKVTFSKNASITNGASIGGTLDIGVTHLNVENGLTFTDNSSLHLRLKAAATDDWGKIVDDNAYGKINVGSGSITIGNNVNLDLTIDYGLHTAADGTEFNLISGSTASGAFTFANSRYKLEAVSCSSGSSGLCYKLKETSNAEEIVQEEKGSQNNQNTAAAVLDGGLFNETDKMFAVASHLDALSQKRGGGRAYLNALTALAPDVSGAVTGQSVLTQTRVSKSVFNRLGGLQKRMGNRSEKYRKMRELYGRSGGSAYNSGLMRSADYYKKAGYYDMPAKRAYPSYEAQGRITPREYDYEPRNGKTYPAYETKGRMPSERRSYDDFDNQPKRKVAKYRSQRQADYGAFYGARPSVGVWAQGLYNTNEYKSASKEDGFSADSTGVSMGLDVIFADVAAIGFGYARTTSDLSALQRSTDVTGDTFFLYGMYKPANWYLSGIVSSGKNTFEEQKDLSGLTVSDNYDTKTIGGQLMLGFDTKGWSPAFGLRYSSVSRAAHEDSVGQKIASFSNSVFSAVAETQKTFELSRAGKGVWSSDLSAGLVYDFSRSEDEATVSLTNGASYTVKGSDMDPYGAELGAGISYVWGSSVDLSARYNLDVRPEWFSHTLTATLRVTF